MLVISVDEIGIMLDLVEQQGSITTVPPTGAPHDLTLKKVWECHFLMYSRASVSPQVPTLNTSSQFYGQRSRMFLLILNNITRDLREAVFLNWYRRGWLGA